MYDIDFSRIGRSRVSNARLMVIAAHMQRERRESGLPVYALGPSETEVRRYLATKIAEAKNNGGAKPDTQQDARGLSTSHMTGFVHSLDFAELDD